ncbi:MAG: ribonuclease H-like domain-containing protein [Clostridium sp.]
MFTREYENELLLPKEVFDRYNMKEIAYFDIETTGFNKVSDIIMLISLGYFIDEKTFITKQYYAEYIEDEEDVVKVFLDDLKEFNTWCTYNGIAFDEPYVIKKQQKYDIEGRIPENHIDLYRLIKPYYTQFGMERCNLKTVEKYLGIQRKDQIDGGLSAQLYKQYLYNNNTDIRDVIMLHNYEDVLNLPILFKLLYTIETDPKIKKEPRITPSQLEEINTLIEKHNLKLRSDLKNITKKAAAKAIDSILNGNKKSDNIDFIIKDTY